MNTLGEVAVYLKSNDDFIIVGHERPDHDSLGSMLGLYFGLRKMGKRCRLISGDPIPAGLSWSGLDWIEYLPRGFDPGESCVIVVDCEPERTGSLAQSVLSAKRLVNIDHHERERGLGDVVYVAPKEAATSVIIYRLLRELGVSLSREIAVPLYGGILGDTGGFRYSNTTPEVLEIGADLLRYDLEPDVLAREIFASHPLSFLRLLGHTLSKLETTEDGRLVWAAVSLEDYEKFGWDPSQHDQLISYIRAVDTAEIAILFRETEPNQIRIGFRANNVDVGSLARQFGGGGHRLASGASITGDLDIVTAEVVEAAKEYLTVGERYERDS